MCLLPSSNGEWQFLGWGSSFGWALKGTGLGKVDKLAGRWELRVPPTGQALRCHLASPREAQV